MQKNGQNLVIFDIKHVILIFSFNKTTPIMTGISVICEALQDMKFKKFLSSAKNKECRVSYHPFTGYILHREDLFMNIKHGIFGPLLIQCRNSIFYANQTSSTILQTNRLIFNILYIDSKSNVKVYFLKLFKFKSYFSI